MSILKRLLLLRRPADTVECRIQGTSIVLVTRGYYMEFEEEPNIIVKKFRSHLNIALAETILDAREISKICKDRMPDYTNNPELKPYTILAIDYLIKIKLSDSIVKQLISEAKRLFTSGRRLSKSIIVVKEESITLKNAMLNAFLGEQLATTLQFRVQKMMTRQEMLDLRIVSALAEEHLRMRGLTHFDVIQVIVNPKYIDYRDLYSLDVDPMENHVAGLRPEVRIPFQALQSTEFITSDRLLIWFEDGWNINIQSILEHYFLSLAVMIWIKLLKCVVPPRQGNLGLLRFDLIVPDKNVGEKRFEDCYVELIFRSLEGRTYTTKLQLDMENRTFEIQIFFEGGSYSLNSVQRNELLSSLWAGRNNYLELLFSMVKEAEVSAMLAELSISHNITH
eukprot:TRINITY_DN3951_c0_g1_i4.p1 TRINITY_DN3951_c0_g1~~TRINITY_DN3951_c0_g1_i4.p1  ORF type:complete len:394 (+),score=67.49 TRINITY_DN3951_c0_g1_i4:155-1336(+)